VVLRARPLLPHESKHMRSVVVSADHSAVELRTPMSAPGSEVYRFAFDACYDHEVPQEALFEREVAPALPPTLLGLHTTVFAYGVTGAGKTHTMQGSPDDPGIIPRTAGRLMQLVAESAARTPGLEHRVSVSYLEIYNEKVFDLLNAQAHTERAPPLHIREDHERNIFIPNLTQVPPPPPPPPFSHAQGALCRLIAAAAGRDLVDRAVQRDLPGRLCQPQHGSHDAQPCLIAQPRDPHPARTLPSAARLLARFWFSLG